ncbi:hypothetical protein [Undibacterium flavidum]|uniref:Uncharacterized protein n=1 Tax=Undibacterium flavidum TaxID=2762297 RepID=A0ABR6YA40_9BURK|nr:hypothetical protein [Undibacterium flavidum]MBC3873499.1 hypothetical protein [Undibacterium flavidum]
MANTLKTAGTIMAASLAIPIAGLSGLGALGSMLGWLFIKGNRTSGVFLFFVIASAIFYITFRFLINLQKKAHNLVIKTNEETNFKFDKSNLLGYPSPVFFAFDRANRKMASFNSVDGSSQIYELSYLLAWQVEWTNKNRMEISGMGNQIDGTNMRVPAFQNTTRRESFCLAIEVANMDNPILKFPMSERAANEWCARLNAIVNG